MFGVSGTAFRDQCAAHVGGHRGGNLHLSHISKRLANRCNLFPQSIRIVEDSDGSGGRSKADRHGKVDCQCDHDRTIAMCADRGDRKAS